jgi:hypothetical protein
MERIQNKPHTVPKGTCRLPAPAKKKVRAGSRNIHAYVFQTTKVCFLSSTDLGRVSFQDSVRNHNLTHLCVSPPPPS